MDEKRREQIRSRLLQRETGDLLDLWQSGDEDGWESGFFDILEEVLRERLESIPPQSVAMRVRRILSAVDEQFERGELEKALEGSQAAVQFDPNSAEAYNTLGMVYDRLAQPEQAIAAYRQAAQLDPRFQEAWENLASIEREMEEDFLRSGLKAQLDQALEMANNDDSAAALAACETARLSLPEICLAYNFLGLILQTAGQYEAAIIAYLEAIRLNPRRTAARENLASARILWEEEQYLLTRSLEAVEETGGNETGAAALDPLEGAQIDTTTPGWAYLDASTYFLTGWEGHRNLDGRSGLDPLETDFEFAHVQGALIRRMVTLRFRTHHPVYLVLMTIVGLFLFVSGVSLFGLGSFGILPGVLYGIYWIPGLALLVNVAVSLWSVQPQEARDRGDPFF